MEKEGNWRRKLWEGRGRGEADLKKSKVGCLVCSLVITYLGDTDITSFLGGTGTNNEGTDTTDTGWLILLATPKFPWIQNQQKKSWTGHPLKWLSQGLDDTKKWQSPELATLNSPELGTLPFFGILALREIWGWQEGWVTLYHYYRHKYYTHILQVQISCSTISIGTNT